MPEWHLYLIRTRLGTLYTGITTDVLRRLEEHAGKGRRGAKYLRSKGPLLLVYHTPIGSQSLALQAEKRMKALAKAQKEVIISIRPDRQTLLTMLDLSTPEQCSQSHIDSRFQTERSL